MKINLEKFLERLKELQGDGSVAALARRIGIKQNTFDLYIKGRRKPSVELVFSIIHNCGVSFEWLFGLSDVRRADPVAALNRAHVVPCCGACAAIRFRPLGRNPCAQSSRRRPGVTAGLRLWLKWHPYSLHLLRCW